MPDLNELENTKKIFAILLGDSGCGKSGSLASLAAKGYTLRILDYDKGLNILADPKVLKPEFRSRVKYVECSDEFSIKDGNIKKATGYRASVRALEKWPGEEAGLTSWGPETILAIDSFTHLGTMCMNYVLQTHSKLNEQPSQPNWGEAQRFQERFIQMLRSDEVKCHVLFLCHVKYMEDDSGLITALPEALGRALAPKVAGYFNDVWGYEAKGTGDSCIRTIRTNRKARLMLKNSTPSKVKASYPIETGLASLFADIGMTPPSVDE